MTRYLRTATIALALLSACAAPSDDTASRETGYTPPEASGLIAVRPFPTEGDVCQVVGENDTTRDYLDDSATLIGCPANELGAIEDRVNAGATLVARAGAWWLLSVPSSPAG